MVTFDRENSSMTIELGETMSSIVSALSFAGYRSTTASSGYSADQHEMLFAFEHDDGTKISVAVIKPRPRPRYPRSLSEE